METTRSQGQLAGVAVLVAVLLALVLRRRHRRDAPAATTAATTAKDAKDTVLDAARQARTTSASTIGRAGEVAHGLLGEASGLLGQADVGEAIDKLARALDDARGALAGRGR